jgi:hypothetical protein
MICLIGSITTFDSCRQFQSSCMQTLLEVGKLNAEKSIATGGVDCQRASNCTSREMGTCNVYPSHSDMYMFSHNSIESEVCV